MEEGPAIELGSRSVPPTSQDLSDREVGSKVEAIGRPPFLLGVRSSTWFISSSVFLGCATDSGNYSIVSPVLPFRLQSLGYENVASRNGWLIASFAAGLIVSSPLVAWMGIRFKSRRNVLVFFLLFNIGAVILFMETKPFWVLVLSRILQGFSGSGILTLGLALIYESVDQQRFGVLMGTVMAGYSLGALVGPPIGGALYSRLGWRAPFVFCIVILVVDLIWRFLIIEKRIALKYVQAGHVIKNFEAPGYTPPPSLGSGTASASTPEKTEELAKVDTKSVDSAPAAPASTMDQIRAFGKMLVSARGATNLTLALTYSFLFGGTIDTALTLYLEYKYKMTSYGAGLVFLGAVIPSLIGSPLSGWVTDQWGSKWVAVAGVVLTALSFGLLIIRGPLPLFIFFLAIFGLSSSFVITPCLHDLSILVQESPLLPATAVFAALNLAVSVGTFIGPIVAGELIGSLGAKTGWIVLCGLSAGLSVVLVPLVVMFVGGPPSVGGILASSTKDVGM